MRHIDAAGGAAAGKPLPPYVHEVHLPDKLPPPPHLGPTDTQFIGSTLPAGTTACEFLPGTCFPLPAGTIIPVGVDESHGVHEVVRIGSDDMNDDSSMGSLNSLNHSLPDSPDPRGHAADGSNIRPGHIRVLSPLTVAAMMSDAASSSSDQVALASLRYKFERLLARALPLNACLCTYDDSPFEAPSAAPFLSSLHSMTSMMSEDTYDDTMSRNQSMNMSTAQSFLSIPSRLQSQTDFTAMAVPIEEEDTKEGGEGGLSRGGAGADSRVHFVDPGTPSHGDGDGLKLNRPTPSPHALILPHGMELIEQLTTDGSSGSSGGMLSGSGSGGSPVEVVTLPKDIFAVTLPVRFELPLGAKLAPGVVPGPGVQISPGTILSRSLEVLEWPAGLPLPPGRLF